MKKNFITLLIILLFCILFSSCNFPLFTTSTSSTTQTIKKTTASTTTTTQRTEPEIITILFSELMNQEEITSAYLYGGWLMSHDYPIDRLIILLNMFDQNAVLTNDPLKVRKANQNYDIFHSQTFVAIFEKSPDDCHSVHLTVNPDGSFVLTYFIDAYSEKSKTISYASANSYTVDYETLRSTFNNFQ